MKANKFAETTSAVIMLLFSSCSDALPLYAPPENFLTVSVAPLNEADDTISYTVVDNNNPNLASIRLTSPFNGYEIRIVNMYEETIQDEAGVEGTVDLVWSDQPDFKAEIPVSLTSVYSGHYDQGTGLMTVNPGDSIILRVYWNFKFTSGEWAFSKQKGHDGPSFFVGPLTTAYYRYHDPMVFTIKAKIKIFRSLSYIEGDSNDESVVLFNGYILSPP